MDEEIKKITHDELIIMLDEMISNVDKLPPGAALASITHLDYQALLYLIRASVVSVHDAHV